MKNLHGFEIKREQDIPELNTRATLLRHTKSGAELLSLSNDDENKVFGITFRTPPKDSTGLPHILEHSVLCGSRKYPIKEPFVELLKGSLQTFLNAMTYPDKTCYPVASQNLRDFYNLVDVYLDAVFYPRLTPYVLQQEGWHYELENREDPITYKGVVFNEMKGAYSSPDNLLSEYSLQSLFPDSPYGLDSGGDPKRIPDLSFEQFKSFHETFYHPANSRIFFYGDDDPEKRLAIADEFLRDFDEIDVDSMIPLQSSFGKPRRIIRPFAASKDDDGSSKAMLTLNWLVQGTEEAELTFAMHILEYILLGMPGSPLRKALIESNLGEDLAGVGLGSEIRQIYFSTGLKGIDLDNSDRIVNLINQTLTRLSVDGIDPDTIEAAVNSIEFGLRENNTGRFPRGLGLMLNALNTWLYGEDPLALVAFEEPLNRVKENIRSNKRYFEEMIERFFLNNPHRTTLILRPDPELELKEKRDEEQRLRSVKEEMSKQDLEKVIQDTKKLRELQERPDSPNALATVPMLGLSDLDRFNKLIPLKEHGDRILYHDLFTHGIAYLDVGFNLHALPQRYLPYIRLFGRALLEMGTKAEDYVQLSQRISRKTGGIWPSFLTSLVRGEEMSVAWMFLRAKAMAHQTQEMLGIIRDVLILANLDNRERFKQIVLEAKAREEQKLVPNGHQVINLRLRSHFNEADWAAEQMTGITYLFFLRDLVKRIDENWKGVLDDLQDIHGILVNRDSMIMNVTQDEEGWKSFSPEIEGFLQGIPGLDQKDAVWVRDDIPGFEGLMIPSQVNYVGKGGNLYDLGYKYHGSVHVITRYLRNSWLWEQVRVRGGAYGSFCLFERFTGTLTFVSYRDPNLVKTLDVFDSATEFLRGQDLHKDELVKAIIGSIGDLDKYKLPDAKGYTSMIYRLTKDKEEDRQKVREEILGTRPEDFRAFGDVLDKVREHGLVKVLGSQGAIQDSMKERPDWLEVLKIL